jgi:hypothetical protein
MLSSPWGLLGMPDLHRPSKEEARLAMCVVHSIAFFTCAEIMSLDFKLQVQRSLKKRRIEWHPDRNPAKLICLISLRLLLCGCNLYQIGSLVMLQPSRCTLLVTIEQGAASEPWRFLEGT